jgi:hypothetical protein
MAADWKRLETGAKPTLLSAHVGGWVDQLGRAMFLTQTRELHWTRRFSSVWNRNDLADGETGITGGRFANPRPCDLGSARARPRLYVDATQIRRIGCVSDLGQETRTAAQSADVLRDLNPWAARARRQSVKRRRFVGAAVLSVACHLLIFFALLSAWPRPEKTIEPETMTVALIDPRSLVRESTSPAPGAALSWAGSPPRRRVVRRTSPLPSDAPLPAVEVLSEDPGPGLSDAQLAGATTAGSGPTGRACDMAGRLQAALRKDQLVQTAVAKLGGKVIVIWNGDWVWIQGEDGKGLTAVRQAMMWEIAFAPEGCRSELMRGLVVFSSNATQRSARLVVGSDQWRWSDLLTPHPAVTLSSR